MDAIQSPVLVIFFLHQLRCHYAQLLPPADIHDADNDIWYNDELPCLFGAISCAICRGKMRILPPHSDIKAGEIEQGKVRAIYLFFASVLQSLKALCCFLA